MFKHISNKLGLKYHSVNKSTPTTHYDREDKMSNTNDTQGSQGTGTSQPSPYQSRFVERFDLVTAEYPPGHQQSSGYEQPRELAQTSSLTPTASINVSQPSGDGVTPQRRSLIAKIVQWLKEPPSALNGMIVPVVLVQEQGMEQPGATQGKSRNSALLEYPDGRIWDRNVWCGSNRTYLTLSCDCHPEQVRITLTLTSSADAETFTDLGTEDGYLADTDMQSMDSVDTPRSSLNPYILDVEGETCPALLWDSVEQACLARFVHLWEGPQAPFQNPIEQELFEGFDGGCEDTPTS
jgi:hypothetical protein